MPGAFLAYYADYVLGAGGTPVAGATVSAYAARLFADGVLPTGGAPAVPATATASTDATGAFVLAGIPPDDYHVLIAYTPPGGMPVNIWRYAVPVVAAAATARSLAGVRGAGLARTLARLATGGAVTIVALGDDVTLGYNATGTVAGGWPALLAANLAVAYPAATVARADPMNYAITQDGPIPGWTTTVLQSGASGQTITVVNAGVRGDTALRALRRFAALVANWPAVDAIIVAFGIWEAQPGNAQQYVQDADFAAHLESLVNVARTLTQAEVLLATPHANPPGAGDIDDYAAAVRGVAARTRCDLADCRALWLDRYSAGAPNGGYDPWLDTTTSALLPTDAGHAAMALEIGRHFEPDLALPLSGMGFDAGKSWELVRIPFSSGQVSLAGSGWTPHGGYPGAVLSSSGGFEQVTSHPGDTVTISGRFVDLAMLCRRWTDAGQIAVSIDGGPGVVVDLYRGYPASTSDLADATGASAPQDRVLLAHGLADTVHTAVLTLLAGKNPASSGTAWRLESLELGCWRRHGYEVEANDAQQRLQGGSVVVPLVGASAGSVPVVFPIPCTSQAPVVVATAGDAAHYGAVGAISQTGFTLTAARRDGAAASENVPCSWMAFG
jgi:lysophospholipase L1-like esterase